MVVMWSMMRCGMCEMASTMLRTSQVALLWTMARVLAAEVHRNAGISRRVCVIAVLLAAFRMTVVVATIEDVAVAVAVAVIGVVINAGGKFHRCRLRLQYQ